MAETTAPTPAPTAPAPVAPTAPTAPAVPGTPAAPPAQQASPGPGAGNQAAGTVADAKKPEAGSNPQADGRGNTFMLFGLVAVMILMFWWMSRSQKKREQHRQEMLKRLKVGERVMTASGIIGEIVELSDDEATLRIDPRKDGRMRIKRGVIVGPAGEASSEQALKEQQPQQ
jgi:preprotein translocase subunit YajC